MTRDTISLLDTETEIQLRCLDCLERLSSLRTAEAHAKAWSHKVAITGLIRRKMLTCRREHCKFCGHPYNEHWTCSTGDTTPHYCTTPRCDCKHCPCCGSEKHCTCEE